MPFKQDKVSNTKCPIGHKIKVKIGLNISLKDLVMKLEELKDGKVMYIFCPYCKKTSNSLLKHLILD